MERLPTGIIPLTSVITYVRYGSSERVMLDYEGSRLRGEARLDQLPEYVTEKGNPGNVKRIRSAEIQLPSEILRRGVFFVDTPGLGSVIFENTQTTRRFIPEIDVLVLVTSYESPMSEDEITFLQQAAATVRAVFVVVNKQDTVEPESRGEVLNFVTSTAEQLLHGTFLGTFSVSAREAVAAKRDQDNERHRNSGMLAFENALLEFVTAKRTDLFILSLLDRVGEASKWLPNQQRVELTTRIDELRARIGEPKEQDRYFDRVSTIHRNAPLEQQRFGPCGTCQDVLHSVLDFLRGYQYELSINPEVQERHAERGGFCPLHTWHYEQITSPRGVCTAYPQLLNHVAAHLRSCASTPEFGNGSAVHLWCYSCPACEVQKNAEDEAIRSLLVKLQESGDSGDILPNVPCLRHLELLINSADQAHTREVLLLRGAEAIERTAEDMQRYAIKHDALRRHLASREEVESGLLGLQLLCGHRNLASTFTIQDIL
jgi:GTP-binding protein EngB required for normal cell division